MNMTVNPKNKILGRFKVPGDKSISHRAVMFASLADGVSEIDGFLSGDDCLSTIECFRKLGVRIEHSGDKVKVFGKGLYGLSKPDDILYAGNSGTTIRLMAGILAGQTFRSVISGDSSIQRRPMDRVVSPLKLMGAKINVSNENWRFAPLEIDPADLHGIDYVLPVASAQVKSAVLLASLYADSPTTIIEPEKSRNHTEIMMDHFGADISLTDNKIICRPVKQLIPRKISIPGDISSAAFFIAAALILPGSHIIIENVDVNETRTGIITALQEMGGDISLLNKRTMGGELIADIEVKYSRLKGIDIGGSIIPKMIDEIPIFAVVSLFAEGRTVVRDASELKVKESNRISTLTAELKKLGADITETDDGMIINGGEHSLTGAEVKSHNDHRIAMSLAVAALKADGATEITNAECINISFPGFFERVVALTHEF